MKRLLQSLSKSRTLRAQAILVGGNFFANIGAYFYHLFMGRLLIPSDYGALQSLISLLNIFTVPISTMNFVITKFVSNYVSRGEYAKISYLFHFLEKILIFIFVIGSVAFLILAKPILEFLHIDSFINFLILDFALFFGLFSVLCRATFQGMSKFGVLTIAQFIDAYGKLILGVIAVVLGLRVPGAFGSFILIAIVSYIYLRVVLKKLIPHKETNFVVPVGRMAKFGIFSFFMSISMMSLYNADVVLVRHFFNAYESGLYAALSILGKIIFFSSAPVAIAMFPLVSEAHARGENYNRIFLQSLIIIVLMCGVATSFFSFYPDIAIKILVGAKYLPAARYLMLFSIFLSLCAVLNLMSSFFLSIHRKFPAVVLFVSALLQIILISAFHSNLQNVILISLGITGAASVFFSFYYVAIARR